MTINFWWLPLAWILGVAWGYFMKGRADAMIKNKITDIIENNGND